MVSYSYDHLHFCEGRCIRCLSTTDEHVDEEFEDEIVCADCGTLFLQRSCFELHKIRELNGLYGNYCDFLHTLRNCDDCRRDFSLCLKCAHFGKKRRKLESGNRIFFSNNSSSTFGPSKYVKCRYCSEFYVKRVSNNHDCFLRKTDSIFGDEIKRSTTIHAQNVFYYDIESRLEDQLECREITMNGDAITVRKSIMVADLESVNSLKTTLTNRELNCMEVVKCKSHLLTLLCVVNSSQSLKKHFCETMCDGVITSFFSWIVSDVLKPMNKKRDQKNDYVFVAHNGSAYDSQFIYKHTHEYFGSRNVQVLMHNNRMIESKLQVNMGFRLAAVYFKVHTSS